MAALFDKPFDHRLGALRGASVKTAKEVPAIRPCTLPALRIFPKRLGNGVANLTRMADVQEGAQEEVLHRFPQQGLAVVVAHAGLRQHEDNTGFVQGQKIEYGARGLADHRVRGVQVGDDVVVIYRKKNGVRERLDGALVQPVMPMRRVLAAPAVVMKLDDQIIGPCLGQDALANDIDTRWLVGGGEQHRRLGRVQTEGEKYVSSRRPVRTEQGIQLRKADPVHRRGAQGARPANLVCSVIALHENLVPGGRLLAQVAVQDVLDPGTVVDKAQQRGPVAFRIAHRIPDNDDVETAGILRYFQPFRAKTGFEVTTK